MDAPDPGGLGGTYAGNPLAVAAAHAVLDVLEEENLLERSIALGGRLRSTLESMKSKVPQLKEVRGPGSMVAAEFFTADGRSPDSAFAKKVQELAMGRGLLLLTCGTHGNVIRFLYPLTIEDEVFAEAMGLLEQSLVEAAASVREAARA
jgi:4-aminobutyrate aminotransferase-like enzyme